MPYALLPLEAQLNANAEAAATLHQKTHGASWVLVPRIDGNCPTHTQQQNGDVQLRQNYMECLRISPAPSPHQEIEPMV
jgi:hypothetical protein